MDSLRFESHLSDIPEREIARLPMPKSLRAALGGARRERLKLALLVVLPLLALWIGAIWAGANGAVLAVLGAGIVYWLAWGFRAIAYANARLQSKAAARMEPQCARDEVCLERSGITRSNAYWTIRLGWELFAGCSEGAEGLYIWTGPHRVIYVPDRVLPAGSTRADLRTMLEGWAERAKHEL